LLVVDDEEVAVCTVSIFHPAEGAISFIIFFGIDDLLFVGSAATPSE